MIQARKYIAIITQSATFIGLLFSSIAAMSSKLFARGGGSYLTTLQTLRMNKHGSSLKPSQVRGRNASKTQLNGSSRIGEDSEGLSLQLNFEISAQIFQPFPQFSPLKYTTE